MSSRCALPPLRATCKRGTQVRSQVHIGRRVQGKSRWDTRKPTEEPWRVFDLQRRKGWTKGSDRRAPERRQHGTTGARKGLSNRLFGGARVARQGLERVRRERSRATQSISPLVVRWGVRGASALRQFSSKPKLFEQRAIQILKKASVNVLLWAS